MYSMVQSLRARGTAGEPLPMPWRAIRDRGIIFRKGQLGLICAAPGTGKSAFSLAYAVKAKVPVLYFSADSDAFDQLTRAICMVTGVSQAEAHRMVLEENLGDVAPALASLPIRFVYGASPTLDDIEESVVAYEEVYGSYPDLIVVDNITNVNSGSGDPFEGLEGLMDYLSTMARETQACVIGLHHVTGTYNDARKPIPLSGIKQQISRVPNWVLTLHRPTEESLGVSPVKYRGGKPDPTGEEYVELQFLGATMTIRDTGRPAPAMAGANQPF